VYIRLDFLFKSSGGGSGVIKGENGREKNISEENKINQGLLIDPEASLASGDFVILYDVFTDLSPSLYAAAFTGNPENKWVSREEAHPSRHKFSPGRVIFHSLLQQLRDRLLILTAKVEEGDKRIYYQTFQNLPDKSVLPP
jgi:hypothetical protein